MALAGAGRHTVGAQAAGTDGVVGGGHSVRRRARVKAGRIPRFEQCCCAKSCSLSLCYFAVCCAGLVSVWDKALMAGSKDAHRPERTRARTEEQRGVLVGVKELGSRGKELGSGRKQLGSEEKQLCTTLKRNPR